VPSGFSGRHFCFVFVSGEFSSLKAGENLEVGARISDSEAGQNGYNKWGFIKIRDKSQLLQSNRKS